MTKLRLLDCFSGIGGMSLGLERSGYFETVAFCEIEPFPRRVLAKHWPRVPCYDDVCTLTADRLAADGIAVDTICGGFPCQDISVAGHQRGIGEGTRSGLWSECIRLIGELRPQFAIFENVPALLDGPSAKPGGWFGRILCDLAECGYDAEWQNIPAAALGAAHLRERVWLVAYPHSQRFSGRGVFAQINSAPSTGFQQRRIQIGKTSYHGLGGSIWDADAAAICRVDDGVPNRLERIKACGNAVVPQIPEIIGRAIGQALAAVAP
jgi:DNA (cytosine-5)-methyltransferase 1